MRYIILTILTWVAVVSTVKAQDCDIALTPVVTPSADGNNFVQVDAYLTNRLRMLTAESNAGSGLTNVQFAITCGYDIIDKYIVSGEPNKIVYRVNYVMHIVDLKGKKIYASYSKELRGVGNNETQSLINTFQKVNIGNAEIKSFVKQGKQKIIEYYDNNYQNVIKGAKASAAVRNFDAAIYSLMAVPACCKGYDIVMKELKSVYQQFINQHSYENLAQARAAWIAAPTSEGAATASVYLSEIYPDAACYRDAQNLANEIKKKMGEDWNFRLRCYNDSVSLERQRISAMRQISIAYANSQPRPEVTNVFWR